MAKQYKAGELTGNDFKRIRQGLLLTQKQLADLLGYGHKIRISEFERNTNPVSIPLHIQEALLRLRESGGAPGAGKTEGTVRGWSRPGVPADRG
jgi:DNA-binding transcriptional regulator YiaG